MKIFFTAVFLAGIYRLPAQHDTLPAFFKSRAEKYLDKGKSLAGYYDIGNNGIKIYSSPAAKEKDSAEFFLSWTNLKQFIFKTTYFDSIFFKKIYCKNAWKNRVLPALNISEKGGNKIISGTAPLKGIKIAIDPGHIGGTEEEARLERKIVKPGADSSEVPDELPGLIEGNLTLQTALLLKKKLEEQGAIVLLTRSKEGENAFGCSFETWMKKDFKKALGLAYLGHEISLKEKNKLLNPKTKKEYLFQRFFLQEDLKKRAEKINRFRPDITVIIHFNADETNKGWMKTIEKNYNMVFIPGAFMENEMHTQRDRFEFLRLLVGNDIENSKKSAVQLIASFTGILQVPAAGENDAVYLGESCLATGIKGVYCRNLALTRFVHGRLVYGESLYQDNEKEFKLLGRQDTAIGGIKTNTRIQQVAEAYFEAILNTFK